MMNRIITALQQHALHQPQKLAFVGDDAQQKPASLNYSQLLDEVKQTAQQLQQWQVKCIALRAENSLDWVVMDLAAMWSHIVMVPVPTFFTHEQVAHLLKAAEVDFVLAIGRSWASPSHR